MPSSVLVLQKWADGNSDAVDSYPIFMATSQKSGKNNSGQYEFKRNADGSLIDDHGVAVTESLRPAAIDHDLDEIAEAFLAWGKQERVACCMEG
jgi:type I restriction enzyme M protein